MEKWKGKVEPPALQGGEYVSFGYKKVYQELKTIGTKWRPNNLRDFFYNTARKYCDHDQIEWAMGHSLPGVRANYLADELKTEYAKFEQAFRLVL
jgi:hypothetical protein